MLDKITAVARANYIAYESGEDRSARSERRHTTEPESKLS